MSWSKAVAVVLELRQKLHEARAVVAETRVELPPGPLCSAALEVIREELRRVDTLDGWTETASALPLPPDLAAAMKRAAQKRGA